jgi:VanZ family protein
MTMLRRVLATWKWVLLYTLLLYSSANYTRRFMDWLESKNLEGFLAIFLMLAVMGLVGLLVYRVVRFSLGSMLNRILILAVFSLICLYCMVYLTPLTIERVHFLEYGFLTFLCYSALKKEHTGFRTYGFALVAVAVIGFTDEVLQGVLPIRYYDNRDFMLNVVAGVLTLVALALFPISRDKRPELCRSDLLVLSSILLILGCLRWVNTVQFDPALLSGTWERLNRCGRLETLNIQLEGLISWRDESGGQASGGYTVSGNRLDGPLLSVHVLEGGGSGPCAWKKGETRDRYFRVTSGVLIFKKEKRFPFRRIFTNENRT